MILLVFYSKYSQRPACQKYVSCSGFHGFTYYLETNCLATIFKLSQHLTTVSRHRTLVIALTSCSVCGRGSRHIDHIFVTIFPESLFLYPPRFYCLIYIVFRGREDGRLVPYSVVTGDAVIRDRPPSSPSSPANNFQGPFTRQTGRARSIWPSTPWTGDRYHTQ